MYCNEHSKYNQKDLMSLVDFKMFMIRRLDATTHYSHVLIILMCNSLVDEVGTDNSLL